MTDYYNHGSVPATNSNGDSSVLRAEFDAIQNGISNKLPPLLSNNDKVVVVNPSATGLTTVATTGTGAVVRATAIDGKANKGANSDITSLSGLTTALSIDQGGTGAGTPSAACTALGAYQKSNIIGTVSQSGGVPTGAIIEKITTADGTTVRYADGTQISTRIIGGNATLPAGSPLTISTPFSTYGFVGDYVLTGGCDLYVGANQTGNNIFTVQFSYVDKTIVFLNIGVSPQLASPTFTIGALTAVSFKVKFMAVGRWY